MREEESEERKIIHLKACALARRINDMFVQEDIETEVGLCALFRLLQCFGHANRLEFSEFLVLMSGYLADIKLQWDDVELEMMVLREDSEKDG
jgi:hypothetical protein